MFSQKERYRSKSFKPLSDKLFLKSENKLIEILFQINGLMYFYLITTEKLINSKEQIITTLDGLEPQSFHKKKSDNHYR